jgi:hypothetical protein
MLSAIQNDLPASVSRHRQTHVKRPRNPQPCRPPTPSVLSQGPKAINVDSISSRHISGPLRHASAVKQVSFYDPWRSGGTNTALPALVRHDLRLKGHAPLVSICAQNSKMPWFMAREVKMAGSRGVKAVPSPWIRSEYWDAMHPSRCVD